MDIENLPTSVLKASRSVRIFTRDLKSTQEQSTSFNRGHFRCDVDTCGAPHMMQGSSYSTFLFYCGAMFDDYEVDTGPFLGGVTVASASNKNQFSQFNLANNRYVFDTDIVSDDAPKYLFRDVRIIGYNNGEMEHVHHNLFNLYDIAPPWFNEHKDESYAVELVCISFPISGVYANPHFMTSNLAWDTQEDFMTRVATSGLGKDQRLIAFFQAHFPGKYNFGFVPNAGIKQVNPPKLSSSRGKKVGFTQPTPTLGTAWQTLAEQAMMNSINFDPAPIVGPDSNLEEDM